MIDHIGLRTPQFGALSAFYVAALAPLGYVKMMEFEGAIGLGKDGVPDLWIGVSDNAGSNVHLALAATSHAAVDAVHAAALAACGKDNGAPGLRAEYTPTYYAAFILDPDGNNLEIVCHAE